MDYVNSYEITALLLLSIVYVFYVYHNWLDLKRNHFFYSLLITTILVTAIDAAGRILIVGGSKSFVFWAMIVAMLANLGLHLISFQLYAYYLCVTGNLQRLYSRFWKIYFSVTILIGIALLTNLQTHFVFCYSGPHGYQIGPGAILLALWTEGYLIAGSQTIAHNRHMLDDKQWKIMLAANMVLILAVPAQVFTPTKFRMTVYLVACVLVLYYITMHMVDRHLVQTSNCFSRVGLRRVIEEKERYQQNFACVAINLTNLPSIISFCSEQERKILLEKIGKYLRAVGNHHGVYQMHESEYILMGKDRRTVEEFCMQLRRYIPPVFRVGGKNLNLFCSYYIAEFADVSYRAGDFYRVMAGLRKVACEIIDHSKTVYYEGEIKESLQHELRAIQEMNEVLCKTGFRLEFLPIFSTEDGGCRDLEVRNVLQLEDGYRVAGEEVWDVAMANESLKNAGLRYFEDAVGFAKKNFLFQQGIDCLHVNLVPRQISSTEMIEQYCDILLTNQVRPEQIVIEIFMDESVPDDILRQVIPFMQEKGFRVLLDQFGVNVCNLKNVLSFPFDETKINAKMATRFLNGGKEQLYHLTHMLKERGWKLSIDGVESMDKRRELEELGIGNVQGETLCDWMSEDQILQWLKQEGGSENVVDAI